MNQFLSNKIIAGIVALALLVGVGVLVSSGDTSSTTRNAALVVATPCTKPGQVTKVSKQSVVCAKTNTGSLWYATMKAKGKAQACKSPGAIRKKSDIVWVCGVVKKKKLWQATQPLPPAVVASTTGIEPGATQPTPALDSTQVATPEAPVVADNTVLADTKIPDDKIVTKVIDDVAPTSTTSTPSTTIPTTSTTSTTSTTTTTIPKTCATGGTCDLREIGPGGGIVFYVAPMPFNCGENPNATPATTCTYLEAAITATTTSSWTPDTTAQWGCFRDNVMTSDQRTASLEIGQGRANTKMITEQACKGADDSLSAASIAKAYNGGGKTDWSLPSKNELNELCKYARNTGQAVGAIIRCEKGSIRSGFAAGYYWSSSESYAFHAWVQYFSYGYQYYGSKGLTYYVRPVRAF